MIKLTDTVQAQLSFQDYRSGARIEGVWLQSLKKLRSENGAFMEYLRLDRGSAEGLPSPLEARQINVSWAAPGRINAFHLHPLVPQDEVWTALQGQLKVWLVDCRAGSASEGLKQDFLLSGEQPSQLFIPAGVAHGYQAGQEGALMLYTVSRQFDPEQPNEGRLPWDFFGSDLWEEDRG